MLFQRERERGEMSTVFVCFLFRYIHASHIISVKWLVNAISCWAIYAIFILANTKCPLYPTDITEIGVLRNAGVSVTALGSVKTAQIWPWPQYVRPIRKLAGASLAENCFERLGLLACLSRAGLWIEETVIHCHGSQCLNQLCCTSQKHSLGSFNNRRCQGCL